MAMRSVALITPFAIAAALMPASAGAAPIALGAFIPSSYKDPKLIGDYGRRAGREPVIVASYKDWTSQPFDPAELNSIWRRGAVPMVTWEPWKPGKRGFGLQAIVAGRFDRYLRMAARVAAHWRRPLFVRFAQEMNGTWFPWSRGVDGNTPRDFRHAWKHIVNLFRRYGATNVKWVWSPNEDASGKFQFAPFYPGDKWVDWVAIDGFNFGGREGWPSFTTIFGSTYDRLVKLSSRPLMIAETAASESGGDKAAWIASAFRREAPNFPHLRALVWFDVDDQHGDFRVDSSAASQRAFRGAVASAHYGATRRTLLATPSFLPGKKAAPAAPGGGYGAPSFVERLWRSLHGKYLWLALAGAAVLLALLSGLGVMLARQRSRRADAIAKP